MPRAVRSKAGRSKAATADKPAGFDVDGVVARLRAALPKQAVEERRMFGGVYFLVNGNMTIGASRRGILVRVGKAGRDDAVTRLGARPADMRGRPMEGYVRVDPAGLGDAALADWVARSLAFARTLPSKTGSSKPARARAKITK
jgi:TfoX/Sxy family transcriptional regulator of competence genes